MANETAEIKESPQQGALLVSLSHVNLIYDETTRDGAHALADISLDVRAGERLCILGANGSGKSTLASVICGLLAPDGGDVRLLGLDVCRGGKPDLEAYRVARRGIGLVFQNPEDQMVTRVVADDVAFGPENLGVEPDEISQRVERELGRVGLQNYAQADPQRLSGGEQQRVAIAGALAMQPRILVLDEPGALLDVRGRSSIMDVMEALHTRGTTIVHITHFMQEALSADRVVVLQKGHIAIQGTPEEVFSHTQMLKTLGLDQPFVAQLSGRLAKDGLPVKWSCSQDKLTDQLLELRKKIPDEGLNGAVASSSPDHLTQHISQKSASSDKKTDISKPSPAVELRHVFFSYNNQSNPPTLVDINLQIAQGDDVALIGQNGSGKSTLLRLICALDTPDKGQVLVDSIDTTIHSRSRHTARELLSHLHSELGYVMQRPERQLFADTVGQDVAFGPTSQGLSRQEIGDRVDVALELCGLLEERFASPFELSGGQQRMAAIAGVLAMHPKILVLDEPSAGLDPSGQAQLHTLLTKLNSRGVTIIRVTHSMEHAAAAQHVVVLDHGHIVIEGKPNEVFKRESASKLAQCGLSLPWPLCYAEDLKEAGVLDRNTCTNPLTLDSLVKTLEEKLTPLRTETQQEGRSRWPLR